MKNNTKEIQSQVIELLRFPLIILVVFVHMIPFERQALSWELNGANVYRIVTEVISHHIGRLAVPCFFLFSGYFFFIKITEWNSKVYASQLKKRFHTLLIPYLLWNILFVPVILFKNLVFQKINLPLDDNYEKLHSLSVYGILWGEPLNFPLWYLRDLIVMVALAPLFYYYFRYTKFIGLILILVIYLMGLESTIQGLSSTAILYFGVGAYMGQFKYSLLDFALSYRRIAIVMAIAMLAVTTYYTVSPYYEYCVRLFTVFGVTAVLYLGYQCNKWEGLKRICIRLAPTVFFIYAIHVIYILGWLKGGFLKSPLADSPTGMLLGYLVIPFLCIGIILLIYRAMHEFFPKTLYFITGSR